MAARDESAAYFPFVAEGEEGPAGFFILRRSGEEAGVLRFGFVILDPALRGRGYGKAMLRLGLGYAFDLYGAKKVTLGVFENNPRACHCYNSLGFREAESTSTYEIGGEAWRCLYSLNPALRVPRAVPTLPPESRYAFMERWREVSSGSS